MDISLLSIQQILTISIFFALLFTLFNKRKPSHKTNLPPGSFGWPYLGETYHYLHETPDKFLGNRMKKYSSKIFKTKLFGEPTVVLCGVEGNKFIATNEGRLFFGWRTPGMQVLFRSGSQNSSPKSFSRVKEVQIIRAPAFLEPKALTQYASTMDVTVQRHLERYWLGKEGVKAYDLALLLNLTLASRFFIGLEDQARILKLANWLSQVTLGMHSTGIDFPGSIFHRAKKSADAARKELLLIIKEKKAEISSGAPLRDILSHMIMKTDSSGVVMSENEISGNIMGLLVAGFSSPAIGLACTLKKIGERPEVYQKVREEQMEISRSKKNSSERLNWEDIRKMKYSWNVMMEVMRLIPPFQGTFREALTDFTYEGYTVPKGWKIYWAVGTTNMDPNCFPNPKKFDPTRFDQENVPQPYLNVPFGGGPWICPGKEFSRMAMLTSLHHIVKAFKWEVMVPDEKMVGSIIPVPAQGVPIRLHPQPVLQ